MAGKRWRWLLATVALGLALAADGGPRAPTHLVVVLSIGTREPGELASTTTAPPRTIGPVTVGTPPVTHLAPTPAAALHISLDPHGRPYDEQVRPGRTAVTRDVVSLHIAGGHLLTVDGIDFTLGCPSPRRVVELGVEDVRLRVIWVEWTEDGKPAERPMGIRLDVPGRRVARWEPSEGAYGTDGGLGGVASQRCALDPNAGPPVPLDQLQVLAGAIPLDLDGVPGFDAAVFDNGFGDGAFPVTRGLDATGSVASVVVWNEAFPWRLAVPDGVPPPDVTAREDALAACIQGTGPIGADGFCITG